MLKWLEKWDNMQLVCSAWCVQCEGVCPLHSGWLPGRHGRCGPCNDVAVEWHRDIRVAGRTVPTQVFQWDWDLHSAVEYSGLCGSTLVGRTQTGWVAAAGAPGLRRRSVRSDGREAWRGCTVVPFELWVLIWCKFLVAVGTFRDRRNVRGTFFEILAPANADETRATITSFF